MIRNPGPQEKPKVLAWWYPRAAHGSKYGGGVKKFSWHMRTLDTGLMCSGLAYHDSQVSDSKFGLSFRFVSNSFGFEESWFPVRVRSRLPNRLQWFSIRENVVWDSSFEAVFNSGFPIRLIGF